MMDAIKNLLIGIGMLAVLTGFALVMFGVITFQGNLFYILNFAGAVAVFLGSLFDRDAYQALFFFVWAVITALAYFEVLSMISF